MKDVGSRLRRAREAAGYRTQKQFAETHGLKQPTYHMHETGKRGLKRETAEHYAELLGVTTAWLLLGDESGLSRTPDLMKKLHIPIHNQASVIGRVAAGQWVEALQWEESDWYYVSVPDDPRYAGVQRYGLEVHGPSMDLVYPEGTVIICVKFEEIHGEPVSGQHVVIYRRNRQGLLESSVKEFVEQDGERWLWPRSSHPDFQQPIRVGELSAMEDVTIDALVIASYRPE